VFNFVFCLTLFVCCDWPELLLSRLGYAIENRPNAFTAANSVGEPGKDHWLVKNEEGLRYLLVVQCANPSDRQHKQGRRFI